MLFDVLDEDKLIPAVYQNWGPLLWTSPNRGNCAVLGYNYSYFWWKSVSCQEAYVTVCVENSSNALIIQGNINLENILS